mgnify:CR=1 FL=1
MRFRYCFLASSGLVHGLVLFSPFFLFFLFFFFLLLLLFLFLFFLEAVGKLHLAHEQVQNAAAGKVVGALDDFNVVALAQAVGDGLGVGARNVAPALADHVQVLARPQHLVGHLHQSTKKKKKG